MSISYITLETWYREREKKKKIGKNNHTHIKRIEMLQLNKEQANICYLDYWDQFISSPFLPNFWIQLGNSLPADIGFHVLRFAGEKGLSIISTIIF